jgi:hypothetical protein
MGSVLGGHIDNGLFDDPLDDADVNDQDADVFDDGREALAGNLEALGIEVERLVDEVPFVLDVSIPFSDRRTGSRAASSKGQQQIDN